MTQEQAHALLLRIAGKTCDAATLLDAIDALERIERGEPAAATQSAAQGATQPVTGQPETGQGGTFGAQPESSTAAAGKAATGQSEAAGQVAGLEDFEALWLARAMDRREVSDAVFDTIIEHAQSEDEAHDMRMSLYTKLCEIAKVL